MPSRRQAINMLASGMTLAAGCSRLETGGSETTGSRTVQSTSTQKQTPSTAETRTTTLKTSETATGPGETMQNTESDSQCPGTWNPALVWQFDTRQSVESVVAGDQSAFALTRQSAAALDPATGRTRWTVSVDKSWGTFDGASFETGDLLVTVTSDGVTAIDTATRTVRWSYTVPGRERTAVLSDVAVHDGVVYVGAVNADTPSFEPRNPYTRIFAVDLETGHHRTFVDVSADGSLPPLYSLQVDESRVYANLNGNLVAYNFDARVQWRTALSPDVTPAFAGSTLVVPTDSGLIGVDPDSGTRRWTRRIDARTLAIEDATAYVSVRSRTANGLAAVDAQNGTVEWQTTTAGQGDVPVVRDGVVYLPVERPTKPDRLTAFDAHSGCRIGSLDFDSDGLYRVAVGDERLFAVLGVSHGELRSFETPSIS